jgi:tetratricopeptide (TPR) repeat protein
LATLAEPDLPLRLFIEAYLLYDRGRFDDAWPLFERASNQIARSHGRQIADLRFYAGDTLVRLERHAEAEVELSLELRHFPQNVRARAALASLYQNLGRTEEAGHVLADLVRLVSTPEAFATAARLWTTFGNPREAARVRAKARQLSARFSTTTRISQP